MTDLNVHPAIFYSALSLKLLRVRRANPSWHWTGGGKNPEEDSNPSHGLTWEQTIINTYNCHQSISISLQVLETSLHGRYPRMHRGSGFTSLPVGFWSVWSSKLPVRMCYLAAATIVTASVLFRAYPSATKQCPWKLNEHQVLYICKISPSNCLHLCWVIKYRCAIHVDLYLFQTEIKADN